MSLSGLYVTEFTVSYIIDFKKKENVEHPHVTICH